MKIKTSIVNTMCIAGLLIFCYSVNAQSADVNTPSDRLKREIPVKKDGIIKFKHVKIDTKNRTISITSNALKANYGLECLLCQKGTKDHESVLNTEAKAWQIHAGLLALGLDPGIPSRLIGDKYVPPRGAKLSLTVKWTDKKGKTHEMPVTDWMKISGKGVGKVKPDSWVFIGSLVYADGSYAADSEGGIISVSNLNSAVIDVPFKSSIKIDQRTFSVDLKKIPPAGTKVELIIKPLKNAEKSPYARAILDIDPWGRLRIDGKPIKIADLTKWASKYSDRHENAMVLIRSDGRAKSYWAPVVQLELKLGGIYYFDKVTDVTNFPILPKTKNQLDWLVKIWKENLQDMQPGVDNPQEDYDALLEAIKIKRKEMEHQKKLLDEYEKKLKADLDKYKARTKK